MRLALLIISSFLLVACISTSPSVMSPDPFLLSPQFNSSNALASEDRWWLEFSDPKLNQLIQQGLNNNYSLKASFARLAQSQAQWDKAGSAKKPSAQLSTQKSRQWQDGLNQVSSISDNWQLGLTASYELDFWGRIDDLDEQALQQFNSTKAATYIQTNTVVSQVTLAWYGWVKEAKQLALLHSQQQRIDEGLKVIRGRYLRGKVQSSDVWQQEQLLEAIHSDIINSQTAEEVYRQQLALWLGQSQAMDATELSLAQYDLPKIDSAIEQVSSMALQQRPDVQQAYAQLLAAHAGLKIAQSNRYPRFTLTASYSGSAEKPSDILDSWLANIIAGIALPLIDGGNLRAEVRRTEAVVDENLANYQQTLLMAIQEVEQALLNERQQFSLHRSLQSQLDFAKKTQRYQSQRYQRGGDFLSLLTSQQEVLQLERRILAATFQQLQYRIQLLTRLSHGRFNAPNGKVSEVE